MPHLRSAAKPSPGDVANTLLSVAVLLQAGSAPLTAWNYLADMGDGDAEEIVAAVDGGADIVDAISSRADSGGPGWSDVAAAWDISRTVGAPLAEAVRALASALEDAQDTADDIRVALTEPAHTARLMSWLPLVGVVLGVALGFDTLGVLFGSLPGRVLLGTGLALLFGGRWWTARLVRRAQPDPGTPGIAAELVAIALTGGASTSRALELLAHAPGAQRPQEDLETTLELSRAAGAPAVELLRASAARQRRRARTEGRKSAAALSARMLIPLGVCTLPAFLCLGVAPLMLSILSGGAFGALTP